MDPGLDGVLAVGLYDEVSVTAIKFPPLRESVGLRVKELRRGVVGEDRGAQLKNATTSGVPGSSVRRRMDLHIPTSSMSRRRAAEF